MHYVFHESEQSPKCVLTLFHSSQLKMKKVLIMIYNGIKRIIRRVGSRLILLTLKRKKKKDVIGSLTRGLP